MTEQWAELEFDGKARGSLFDIARRGSTVGREVLGGATTFLAMSYIIFVQVGLLSSPGVGMDSGGVIVATCLSAAAGSILMGLWANYPVALAPGMGENFFFALQIVPAMAAISTGHGWQMALALTVLSGALFLLLSLVGFRSALLNAIPDSLKSGIAAGIGLFIAIIGFKDGNLVPPADAHSFGRFIGNNPVAILTLIGLAVTLALSALKLRGAILLGILATAVVGHFMGMVQWSGRIVAWPHGLGHTAGGFATGFREVWAAMFSPHAIELLVFTFVLLFMVMFDTVGTLIGVASRADLVKAGRLPKAERALAADAAGTIVGGMLGASTVTSYIESITGVQAGARTGLAAVVTGVLMALTVFFIPIAQVIGRGVVVGQTTGGAPDVKYPLIAPALIIVGSMMMRTVREIDWEDVTEYLPAFLTILVMPLLNSIALGIAAGFIAYALGKCVSGRARQCPGIVYIFAALFVLQFVLEAVFLK